MNSPVGTRSQTQDELSDAFLERMLQSAGGFFDILGMYFGVRLGLYRALADHGAQTTEELASQTKTHERYLREWVEQQAVTGVIEVENEEVDPGSRRYHLPNAYQEVLLEETSLNYLAPLTRLLAGTVRPLDSLLAAFRSGEGVPYGDYGEDLREGQAALNRPMFLQLLGQHWIPAMPDVHQRFQEDPPARVADIGCGAGWSSIGLAQVFPRVEVDGFDFDEPSIELANKNVKDSGLSDRVKMQTRDAGDPELAGTYDLVMAFECIHDLSDPVGVLRIMKRLAGERGTVFIMDEKVSDRFRVKESGMDWFFYGFSFLHCLPAGMTEKPSAETGTVMRPDTLRRYAEEAGYSKFEILPIENFFFRFYRLNP